MTEGEFLRRAKSRQKGGFDAVLTVSDIEEAKCEFPCEAWKLGIKDSITEDEIYDVLRWMDKWFGEAE